MSNRFDTYVRERLAKLDYKPFSQKNRLSLPCPRCERRGWYWKDGRFFNCKRCSGFGILFCTLDDIRKEYGRLRKLFSDERGMLAEDVDEWVGTKVKQLEKTSSVVSSGVWFDVLFFRARDFGLLEKWWTIQRFGKKITT